MLKVKEYHICDRCKKEISEDKINYEAIYQYMYELCDNCCLDLKDLKEQVKYYEQNIDDEFKRYQFGKYLPKDEENKNEKSN